MTDRKITNRLLRAFLSSDVHLRPRTARRLQARLAARRQKDENAQRIHDAALAVMT